MTLGLKTRRERGFAERVKHPAVLGDVVPRDEPVNREINQTHAIAPVLPPQRAPVGRVLEPPDQEPFELAQRVHRNMTDGRALLAPGDGPRCRVDLIGEIGQPPDGAYDARGQRRAVPLTGARFDAARADLCGIVRSQDRFARQVEGLTEIQEDIDQAQIVGKWTEPPQIRRS